MANNGIGQPASAQVTLKVLCESYNNFTKILCKFTLILYENLSTLFRSIYKISDPPEIIVEQPVVFSGEGREATLVCIIHGVTEPEVTNCIYLLYLLSYTLFNVYVKVCTYTYILCCIWWNSCREEG